MKTFTRMLALVVLLLFLAGANASRAQTEGNLVSTDETRLEVTKLQDRAIERKLKIEQIGATDSPMGTATSQTRALMQNVQSGNLEDAARLYFQGVENGVPDLYRKTADEFEKASREAASDAASVVRLSRAASKSANVTNIIFGTTADGANAREIDAALRKVEEQNKALTEDLKTYVAKLIEPFPEMKHVLAEAGLTPATLREIVEGRLGEADQFAYRAKLFRVNAMIWESLPRIIKTRAVNGGKGQPIITNSASDTIKAAESAKIL